METVLVKKKNARLFVTGSTLLGKIFLSTD